MSNTRRKNHPVLWKSVQVAFFFTFFALIYKATWPLDTWLRLKLFLELDPYLSIVSVIAARTFIAGLLLCLFTMVSSLVFGRIFCGYVCPMGTFIDLADWAGLGRLRKKLFYKDFWHSYERRLKKSAMFQIKYVILGASVITALFGFSLVYIFDPLSIFTRFSALVLYPVTVAATNTTITFMRTPAEYFNFHALSHLHITQPVYSGNVSVACILTIILFLNLIALRAWCRYACPSGAILGLLSIKPAWRRHVSDACDGCGKCSLKCSMGCIPEDQRKTRHSECITCRTCVNVCPKNAVSFGFGILSFVGGSLREKIPHTHFSLQRNESALAGCSASQSREEPGDFAGREHNLSDELSPSREKNIVSSDFKVRRILLGSVITGGAMVVFETTLCHPVLRITISDPVRPSLIRPPGALPEPAFNSACTRCGECMRACVTNTIQPSRFEAGLEGLWAPRLDMRYAACEQQCNVCGLVCPTGAIRPLSMDEKQYAKIGTAHILKEKCLAWGKDRRCLICDEQCPYNAIVLRREKGLESPVPHVLPDRCNGCGQCENACPVEGDSAIIVKPDGELRLSTGSYVEKAKELGFIFQSPQGEDEIY